MIKAITTFALAILLLVAVSACKSSISADDLYGKWRYTTVMKPNAVRPDSVSNADLRAEAPFIEFSKDGKYVIVWGGALLSRGTFAVEGRNIWINEVLEDGSKRKFPFWVSVLTDKDITFETKGADASRVTAVKN